MATLLIKSVGVWLVLLVFAMINGLLREKILTPLLGIQFSLPLSGIIFSSIIFLITFIFIPLFGKADVSIYFTIGSLWVLLTLGFEFLFGHFVTGKNWLEIIQVSNIKNGDLFLFILIVSAISPWLAARSRGFFVAKKRKVKQCQRQFQLKR